LQFKRNVVFILLKPKPFTKVGGLAEFGQQLPEKLHQWAMM